MPEFSIKNYQEEFSDILKRIGRPNEIIARYKDLPSLNLDFDVYLPTLKINLQRDFVWTLVQQQEFILSIFKNIYLPPVSLIVDDTYESKTYQVIDGKQRISTIISFLENKFSVNINNVDYFYSDLDKNSKIHFTHKPLLGYILYTSSDFDPLTDIDKIKWFKYINFAGTPQDKTHLQNLLNRLNEQHSV